MSRPYSESHCLLERRRTKLLEKRADGIMKAGVFTVILGSTNLEQALYYVAQLDAQTVELVHLSMAIVLPGNSRIPVEQSVHPVLVEGRQFRQTEWRQQN